MRGRQLDLTCSLVSEEYDKEPGYSDLLDELTSTPEERMTLLRSYFEPAEEEQEEGKKTPTAAHRAIANLVKLGYVRMILTTNFDRLIEQALEAEGIRPDVLSTPEAVHSAMPYTHSSCVVVKLHGDYRDPRIRNTDSELAEYPEELNCYLDRVLGRLWPDCLWVVGNLGYGTDRGNHTRSQPPLCLFLVFPRPTHRRSETVDPTPPGHHRADHFRG